MMTAIDIAGRLGLQKYRRSWRGTCPACDYARTFSIRELKGRTVSFCANGCGRDALADALARVTGADNKPAERATENQDDAARRAVATADALKIWAGSTTAMHTLADAYLTRRTLPGLAASAALRFRGDCHHPEQRGRYPALVALVVDVAGKPVAVHRSYLAAGGVKASLVPPKASKGPVWGGAIRLDPEAPEIVVGEGIESSASAGRLVHLPAWAALSAGNMARGLILPPGVRSVVIAADADEAGKRAAEAAADRWRAEGRRVRIARPDRPGQDFNDILRERGEVPHAA
jgi:putative DNA primase/helicase